MRIWFLASSLGIAVLSCAPGSPPPAWPAQYQVHTPAECGYSFGDSTPIYIEAEVDRPPRLLRHGTLTYPADLRDRGVDGWVIIHFVIDTQGSVIPASVGADTASDAGFIPAAVAMITSSRFAPGWHLGTAVPVCVRQRVNWTVS
jgi:hypothetical protein